jgi:hypothetical protein
MEALELQAIPLRKSPHPTRKESPRKAYAAKDFDAVGIEPMVSVRKQRRDPRNDVIRLADANQCRLVRKYLIAGVPGLERLGKMKAAII